MLLQQNQPRRDVHDVESPPLREYLVLLSSGEYFYILAADSEQAAWDALELSNDKNSRLLDVRLSNEW
jgi:hypothetical protein